MEAIDVNDSANSNGQEVSPRANIPSPDETREDDHDTKGSEIPLPPETSDSGKYSPSQAEEGSPNEESSPKKPVLPPELARKRFLAMSRQRQTLAAARSSAPSQSSKKPASKGVSQYSGRANQTSQPVMLIDTIMKEEKKLKERMGQAGSKFINVSSMPTTSPATAIVKPLQMSEPRALPIEDVPLKKSEPAAKESRGADSRSSSSKNYRQRRSSSGSSASPAISRSISPRRRPERRSRSRDRQEVRRRDRDEDRGRNYRAGRRSRSRERDIRRRSRSPNPKEKTRRRGSRSLSPDNKRRDRERHRNAKSPSPSNEHEKQRKIKVEEDKSFENRRSRRERSSSFVLEKSNSFRSHSPKRSFENNDVRLGSGIKDRRHRDSSSRDSRAKNNSRREQDQELEKQQKQLREEEELRIRKEAEEKELDRTRTSRLPLDWTDYKKFEYTDKHISSLKNRMDTTRTTQSSSPSSSRDSSPSEPQQFFSRTLIHNPEVVKCVELNSNGRVVEAIVKRTKSKIQIEYTVPKNSCVGCYTSRNVIWKEEDPQVLAHMDQLLEMPISSSLVEIKSVKGFRFLKLEQDLCPSDGSRGVNISRLYSDEESDDPVVPRDTTNSEVFKLRKEDSVEGDRASPSRSDEMEEDYASDSAESVPSPLLKKRYDEEVTSTAVENPIASQPLPPALESPEDRSEEVKVSEKLGEKPKSKSRKEKKRKAKGKKKRRKRDSSSSSSEESEESEDEAAKTTKKRSRKRQKEEKPKKDKKNKRSKKRKHKSETPESSSSSSSDSESSSSESSESDKDKKKKSKKKKTKKKSRHQKRDKDSPDDDDQNKGDKSDKGGDAGSTSKRGGDADQHEDGKGGEKRRRTTDRKHREDRKKDSSKHRKRSQGINADGLQFEVSSPASTDSGSGSDNLNKLPEDFEKWEDELAARLEADTSVVTEELLGVKEDLSALPSENLKTDVKYDPFAGDSPSEQLHSNPIPVITRRGSGDALHRKAEAVLQMTQVDNDDVKLLFDNDFDAEFDADQMLDLLSGGNNGDSKEDDCIDYLTKLWDRYVDDAGTTPGSKSEADSAYISDDEKFRLMIPPVPTSSSRVFSIPEPPGYRQPAVTEPPYKPGLTHTLKSRSPSLSPPPRSPRSRSRSRSRSISPSRRRSRTRYEEDRRYRGRDSDYYDSRYRDRDSRDRSYRPRRPYRDDDEYGSSRSRDRDRDYYYGDDRRFRERPKRERECGRYTDRLMMDKGRFEYDTNIDKRISYNTSHQMRSPLGEPAVYLAPAGYAPPEMMYTTPPGCLQGLPPPGFDPTVPPPMFAAVAAGPLDPQMGSLQPHQEQRLGENSAFELPFPAGELEGNHRNPSNLREIVPAVSFVEGNRSPKRLSLDERLEVEMGIKITRDDSSNMPLVGGFAGFKNVPQLPTPNPALLQSMQQASIQPFHQGPENQLQSIDNDPILERALAEHSTAIMRGNLIKVVPMVPIERSFTVTKINCKWNPIVVQQTAEQVVRKEGDEVPPKRCVAINVPTVPFEIPLINPDEESSVTEHPEDLVQRLKDERRQARKKKLEIKRKRQLRKKMERRKLIKNIPTDEEDLEMIQSVDGSGQIENRNSGGSEGYIGENYKESLKTDNIENLPDDSVDIVESEQVPEPVIENRASDLFTLEAPAAPEPNGEAEEEMSESSPRPAFEPLSPQKVPVPDPWAEPAKSILAITGFRRGKEQGKGVRFVDGIIPGYGSSRSEGEEEVLSPAPGFKAKTLGKKKEKRKRVRSAVEEERRKKLKFLEDAELMENQEPPPPPSAPYPYCPLGILYQFNPPYAVLYAQAVVEHGFEITFTPSIVEPKAVFYDWPAESTALNDITEA